jgi:flavin reductase (DIM6/NTAB) family NADH-FMN oxidoreductase RutF
MNARSLDYRRALGQFATGVTVVTTRAADGAPTGLTVNSFNSVSLAPPLVLWSLANGAGSFAAFDAAEGFVVNVLGRGQLELARRFSARGVERFGPDTGWEPSAHGWPRLAGCVAWFECLTRHRHPAGDHTIFVAEVVDFQAPGGDPLVFHDGRYVSDARELPLPPGLRDPWR